MSMHQILNYSRRVEEFFKKNHSFSFHLRALQKKKSENQLQIVLLQPFLQWPHNLQKHGKTPIPLHFNIQQHYFIEH